MEWDRRSIIGMTAFGGVLVLLAGGGYLASRQGKLDPPVVPVPAATPAQPIELAAGGRPASPITVAPSSISSPPTPVTSALPTPGTTLKVYVSGEVKTPGLYTLPAGSRIADAIHAAGGFTANARQDAINLADFALDADQYNIPAKATPAAPRSVSHPAVVHSSLAPHRASAPPSATPRHGGASGNDASPATKVAEVTWPPPGRVIGKPPDIPSAPADPPDQEAPSSEDSTDKEAPAHRGHASHSSAKFHNPGDGVVNLNTATAEELQKLPGVGESTAEKILEYRQQIGQFSSIEQLREVKGIGEKKFAKMQPFLTVN